MGYIGSQPATNFETVRKQVSTTNSGTTITLDYSVSSVQDILVTVNAVVQSYDNYSVSGTTLTLGGTLNNDRVEILYVGRTFQTVTPAVGTVTNEMLSGSIANSKLANSSITLNGSAVSLGGSATVGIDNTPIFLATLGSTQNSISRSTQTKITYAAEVIDSDNAFDTSTNRFTIPSGKSGKYMFIVSASAQMPSYDPQAIMTSLYKNGSQVAFHQYFANEPDFQNDQDNQVPLVTIQNLSAGDYVEGYINFYQSDGGTGNIQNNNGSFFQGFRITT